MASSKVFKTELWSIPTLLNTSHRFGKGVIYISLPGHPLYGQRVRLTHYEPAATARFCLIEDLLFPNFHYQIKATWLSSTPPPLISASEFKQPSIQISLPALRRMVQVILIYSQNRRASEDEQSSARTSAKCWRHQVNNSNGVALARERTEPHPFHTAVIAFGRYCSASARWAGPI
jgi:hypothetical protein